MTRGKIRALEEEIKRINIALEETWENTRRDLVNFVNLLLILLNFGCPWPIINKTQIFCTNHEV